MKTHLPFWKNKGALGWILAVVGHRKYGVLALTVLNSLSSGASVVFALLLKEVIDAAVKGGKALFWRQFSLLFALILGQILLRAVIRRVDERVRSGSENALKSHAYRTILTRAYGPLAAFHTGELQTRLTADTAVVADGVTGILPNVVAMAVKLVAAAGVLLAMDRRFAMIFLIGGAGMLLVTYGFRRIMKRLHKRVQEADGTLRAYMQETTGNLLVLRSFGGESRAAAQAQERMKAHRAQRLHRNLFSIGCNMGFSLVMNGGYLLALGWGAVGIMEKSISYGTLTAVLQLVNQIQAPFANISGFLPRYYAMLASAERLMELDALPPDSNGEKLSPEEVRECYGNLKEISARNLTFAYPEGMGENVLEEASVTIRKGEFVAITGRSGIGKSTLLKLLLGIYNPDQGELILNTAEGTLPVSPRTRPLFAYVPQGNFLLSGTIAQAVSFLEDDPDLERIRKACSIACADFIYELPKGLETELGEKGAGLSEGQIQRLAVARAIYSGAPILLLDESTSALDEASEQRLLRNIRELTDRTVLIVTHRRAALSLCDRQIELKEQKFSE